jgi:hypothetical protein
MQAGALLLLDIHLFTIHPQVITIGLDLRGISQQNGNRVQTIDTYHVT